MIFWFQIGFWGLSPYSSGILLHHHFLLPSGSGYGSGACLPCLLPFCSIIISWFLHLVPGLVSLVCRHVVPSSFILTFLVPARVPEFVAQLFLSPRGDSFPLLFPGLFWFWLVVPSIDLLFGFGATPGQSTEKSLSGHLTCCRIPHAPCGRGAWSVPTTCKKIFVAITRQFESIVIFKGAIKVLIVFWKQLFFPDFRNVEGPHQSPGGPGREPMRFSKSSSFFFRMCAYSPHGRHVKNLRIEKRNYSWWSGLKSSKCRPGCS